MASPVDAPARPSADPEAVAAWAGALERAVERAVGGADALTVAYSGGLDSSLVALLAGRRARVTLLVIGTVSARDPEAARRGARSLGLPLVEACLGPQAIRAARATFAEELDRLREPAYSVALGSALLLARAPDRRVLWGQGADELFFGYARYRTTEPARVPRAAAEDLRRLVEEEAPRSDRLAARLGHDLKAPFLDPEVRDAAARWPPPLPTPSVSKPGLRAVARRLGLPEAICGLPKRALQYGSGVRREVERDRARPATPA